MINSGMNSITDNFFFVPLYLLLWTLELSFHLSASQMLSQTAVYTDCAPKMGAINLLYFTGVLDSFIC